MNLTLRSVVPFALAGGLLFGAGCTVPPPVEEDAPAPTLDVPVTDVPSTCETGYQYCGGECVRTAADSNNCGSCGVVCPAGSSCAVGRCDCIQPELSCDGVCIDLTDDPEHCGDCDTTCAATEICSAGECIVMCTEDNHRVCVNTDEAGERTQICADLMNDNNNCGTCNTRCTGGATCNSGVCSCPAGQMSCGGVCADINTDPLNCGTCLNSCGEGGTCSGGRCSACGDGRTLCGSVTPRCFDTDTSTLHCGECGNSCYAGGICVDGVCECPEGRLDCRSGSCIDPMTNAEFCGDCDTDCGAGGACADGVCTCATGFTMCGTGCFNLMTSRTHCGECDNPCEAGTGCVAGECVVPPLYHGWTSPVAGCSTTSYDTTLATPLGGTFPFNTGDTVECRAWKLAATVCTTEPTRYLGDTLDFTCPVSGGFEDPVFGAYCRPTGTGAQFSCADCVGACNGGACTRGPLTLRNCSNLEVAVR